MRINNKYENQKYFWEYAGNIGYGKAIFSNPTVERHITTKQWQSVIYVAGYVGLDKDSRVIELGCGDGNFAENVLSCHYKHVDAYDMSRSAIESARSRSKSENVSYYIQDISTYDFGPNAHWDGAFLIGFIHHIKDFAPLIISRLAKVCPKVIVLEPNGDNIVRKLLEQLPSYRQAGENSFRLKEIINIFNSNDYTVKIISRINIIPPFLPEILFPSFKSLERLVESIFFLNKMCATYILGFEHRHWNK
ncbi:MAG: class I SAM-dependent methyltransferase [Candidatus Omnitrophota bacterium]|nr:class I SAM-dependent methyltransferase [Candidatus Omnitrophota bacterium]